jgi:hypothetical protein
MTAGVVVSDAGQTRVLAAAICARYQAHHRTEEVRMEMKGGGRDRMARMGIARWRSAWFAMLLVLSGVLGTHAHANPESELAYEQLALARQKIQSVSANYVEGRAYWGIGNVTVARTHYNFAYGHAKSLWEHAMYLEQLNILASASMQCADQTSQTVAITHATMVKGHAQWLSQRLMALQSNIHSASLRSAIESDIARINELLPQIERYMNQAGC